MSAPKTVTTGIMFVGAAILGWHFLPDPASAIVSLGCGTVNAPTKCAGCSAAADNCHCSQSTNKCETAHNVCPKMSTAFTVCDPPDSGTMCFMRIVTCSWRYQCNNSQGQDLGPCTTTCETSTEKVGVGGPHAEYFCDDTECECTGVPV